MSRTRWVLLLTFGALAAVLLAPRTTVTGPFTPASEDQVVETVPAQGEARKARAAARAALAQRPDDVEAAVKLARGYLEAARAQGNDVRLIGRAQAALAPWWTVVEAPAEVRLLRATIKQSLHDFTGARVDLDALVVANPNDIQAWLTRATVAQVVGDYAEAKKSCDALEGNVAVFIVTVCRAPLLALEGDASGAANAIELAMKMAEPRLRAWALSVMGELRQFAGETAEADAAFGEALQLEPTDDYTRGAWADLMLDTGRAEDAAKLLAGHESNDALLLRLCIARGPDDASCTTIKDRVAATRQRGDVVHRREESRFALHVEKDSKKALELAVANYAVQKEPADVRVLLEAADAAGDSAAAAPALEWMKKTKFQWPAVKALAAKLEKPTEQK
jgi:tetratricopeptide (TPR) repeat protein